MSNVITPPTPFDFKQPPEPPVVFLAGAIDQGKAEDWQTKVIKELNDVPCTILNPRRDDWDCVDSETMALTPDGPKSYSELRVGDDVFTFSQDRDVLEIQPIEKMNVFEIDDEMVEFIRNDCSFFFTKNHDLLDRTSFRHSRTRKVKAGLFVGKKEPVRFPAGKFLQDGEQGDVIPYGNGFMDDHFRLAAWILSEGSIFVRKDTGAMQVTIAQYKKNHQKVKEIGEILDRLGMRYHRESRQFVLDKESSDFVCGIAAIEKYTVPKWVMDAPIRQKKIFIREYAKGDGCMVGDRISYLCFGDKYRSFAQQMMVLCFGAGIGTKWKDKTSGFGHPVINLVPHNDNKKWFCMKCERTVRYRGVVWCPTTKNGTWVAYRNGLPFITGNSSWVQSINNPQFREQVEWELKGLEQCSLIALALTKDSKAPISLLELGLHASDGKMVVFCPKGFWRKGNVDIVCNTYDVPVFENFGEFVAQIRATITVKSASGGTKTASDRVVRKMFARAFVMALEGVEEPDWLRNPVYTVEGPREASMITASQVKKGDICTVNASYGILTSMLERNQLKILRDVVRQGGGKVYVESVRGDTAYVTAYDNPMSRIVGGVQVPVSLLKPINFTAGDSLLRGRPDYGENEADIEERMKNLVSKIASTETYRIMIEQFRPALARHLVALENVFGGKWTLRGIHPEGGKVMVVEFGIRPGSSADQSPEKVGFRLEYDYVSGVYKFTPFSVTEGKTKLGRIMDGFYTEELSDIRKLIYLYRSVSVRKNFLIFKT